MIAAGKQSRRALLWCRRREEQSVKLRKTAEKLLMNQLKKHALKNMSGSQQAAVLAQAKQTQQASSRDPSPSDEIPVDLLVRKSYVTCLVSLRCSPACWR